MNNIILGLNNFWSGAIAFLILSGLLGLACRQSILSFIQNNFSKNLEKYKYELNTFTESMKFTYQKKLSDFNYVIKKKHQVYPKLYENIMIAESHVNGLEGGIISRDFIASEDNRADIINYMETRSFPEGKKEKILSLWNEDRKQEAIKAILTFARISRICEARIKVHEAQNFYWLSIIYLSDEIKQETLRTINKLNELLGFYEVYADMSTMSPQEKTKKNNLKTELNALVPSLIEKFRQELQENLQ